MSISPSRTARTSGTRTAGPALRHSQGTPPVGTGDGGQGRGGEASPEVFGICSGQGQYDSSPGRWARGGGQCLNQALVLACRTIARSEERRVGKECRSRWSPYH